MDLRAKLKFVITNKDAALALTDAKKLVESAAEDLPWREDLQQANELLQRAIDGLDVRSSHESHDGSDGRGTA